MAINCVVLVFVNIFGSNGSLVNLFFFFFKQKTAYEMLRSLVGSEMCIRDRRKSMEPVWKKFEADIGRDLIDAALKSNK